jgi:hypothetical protein
VLNFLKNKKTIFTAQIPQNLVFQRFAGKKKELQEIS